MAAIFTRTLCALAGLLVASLAAAIELGQPAPDFELKDRGGEEVAVADFAGEVVYVDFWASWCGPCILSFPVMEDLHQRYADRGLKILAVNVDQRREDADSFLEKREVSFSVLFDGAGKTPADYAVKGMPTSYILDRQGRVVHIHEGFKKSDAAKIELLLEQVLSEP